MLQIDKTALVLVDIQNNLARVMSGKEELFDNLAKLVQGAKVLDIPILWMEQVPEKLGSTIDQLAELLYDNRPISKSSFSCCGNEEFREKVDLLEQTQYLVAGIECHVCVYQTVMDLMEMGKETYIVADATSARTVENKQIGIDRMVSEGAILTSVEMALFEILAKAEGGKFKEMVKIVK